MSRINYLKEIKKRFETFRAEVGDYKPEAFDYLEKRFYELYKDSRWRYFVKKQLKKGQCPVKEWIKSNWYPKDNGEKTILESMRLLTEDSKKNYVGLMGKYVFKLKNSQAFREQCDRQDKHGFNPFAIWLDNNNFRPVFK